MSIDDLEGAVTDLLNAMSKFNLELNGPVPSESSEATDSVPRSIAYAVAEIARMLRETADGGGESASETSRAAWRVEAAWRAVLAGDTDDLRAHVRDEEMMRHRKA